MREPFRFEGVDVEAGTAVRIPVQFGLDPLGRQLEIPVHILHGSEDGPILGITSTIHPVPGEVRRSSESSEG